jgi:ABC-type branched-subunit amino acid transport system substrate-binding protein
MIHRSRRRTTLISAVALVAVAALVACSSNNGSGTSSASSPATSAASSGSQPATSAASSGSQPATSAASETSGPASSSAESASSGPASSSAGASTDNGGATDTGVTADQILLGTTQPLTGPAAPGYSKISAAMNAYFAFANASGGVNGRKITLKVLDDGYNPANTAKLTRELVLQDKVFALVAGLGTPTQTSVLDFVNSNKVPQLFVASGSRSWNQPQKYPYTFGWQVDYTVEGKILGDYIKKNFAGKKVCSFGQGDDFGTDGVQGVELTLGKGSVAVKQTYSPTNTNVGPQIGALQAAKCEVVVAFTVPGFTALALGTAAQLKYQAQWVVSNVGADIPTLTGFLKNNTNALLQGVVSDNYLPMSSDASNSWTKLFQMVDQKYDNNAPFDGNVFYGMAIAYTTLQVLQAAGPHLTRQALIDAVQKNGLSGPGLVPFAYSADSHSGYIGTQIAVVKNGVATPTGPIYTTDDAGGPLTEYTTAQPQAPADGLPTAG